MPRISVLVPFGADDSPAGKQRREVWQYIEPHWRVLAKLLDLEVIVGNDVLTGQPLDVLRRISSVANPRRQFSVSRALNDAARWARGSVYILFGADHMPDEEAIRWAVKQLAWHPWQRIYDRVGYLSEAATKLKVQGYEPDRSEWHEVSAPCPGVLAVRRDAWNFVGGMNEDYEGHGYEDSDLFARLSKEFGDTAPASGRVLHELWHPAARVITGTSNEARYRETWGHSHGL
jgi:hypothetical protein